MGTSIIIFCCALTARALFSFLETSITALRLFKLKEIAASTNRYGALFQALEKNPHRVLISILIANSLADVTTAALATQIMEEFFESINLSGGLGFFLGIAIATAAILIFGEIIPKNLAKGKGESFFRSTLWLTNILFYTLYPVVNVLLGTINWIMYAVSGKRAFQSGSEWVSSEKEIQFLISYIGEKGLMESEKTEMLHNIFDLGHTPVKEVMVPATEIISIDVNASTQDILSIFIKHNYTRLPAYEREMDNVIGMVHLKDVFALIVNKQDKPLKEMVRPILFVPESMKINQLLRQFRQQHKHIAMAINEYGSIIGLVTLEDVLEEIVGDISDEHEPEYQKIIELQQGGWMVDASVTLEELSDVLNISFDAEDALTLGGFLIEKLQHLPKKGERFLYQGLYFQIQKASRKRVIQVLIFTENNEA